jgi:hypothetical protein
MEVDGSEVREKRQARVGREKVFMGIVIRQKFDRRKESGDRRGVKRGGGKEEMSSSAQ